MLGGLANALLRQDPFRSYDFMVQVDGIYMASFAEAQGLSMDLETEKRAEGGVNDYERILIKGVKYSDITLKRGITLVEELWNWCEGNRDGEIERKNGSIFLTKRMGELAGVTAFVPVIAWNFYSAVPIKWEGPSFESGSSGIAMETLTIAHEGLDMFNPLTAAVRAVKKRRA